MITIHHLEVRFDVEGDEDKQEFARLFNQCIRQWAAEAEENRIREQAAMRERSLTGSPIGGTS